jgi:hypothetical protein
MLRSPLSSPLRHPLSSPLAARRGGGAGPAPDQLLGVPSGFDWTPPVNVYRTSGGTYYTDYDPTPFLIEGEPGVTTMYVDSATGNNSNPGTAALPKATLLAASNMGRQAKLLIKARGTFNIGVTSQLQVGHDELVVEAWGGDICVITTEAHSSAPLVWTDEGGGVWSAPAPSASFNSIAPYLGTDVDALVKYPLAASLVACQATPGTYFRVTSPSIRHYVHTIDGTSPATGHTIYAANGSAQLVNWGSFSYAQTIGFYGVDFRGGVSALRMEGTSAFAKRMHLVNCFFKHGSSSAAMQWMGGVTDGVVISYGCTAGPSDFDCFSYHTSNGSNNGTPVPNAIEINCTGTGAGKFTGANQGSTTHFGGKVLRVNGTYSNNQHDQVADVGAGTRSWNVGCTAGPRRSGDTTNAGFIAGNDASDVRMWLDGCAFDDVQFDVNTASGGSIYYRNMPAPNVNPASAGVVGTY